MSDANGYIQWLNKKLKLNTYSIDNKTKLMNWKINRGQIYTCFLGENIGFEKSKMAARPCIIVSTQRINHESGNVIIIPHPKLQFDSVIQCEDIRCVSKARLSKFICNVRSDDMNNIKKRLKNALQI